MRKCEGIRKQLIKGQLGVLFPLCYALRAFYFKEEVYYANGSRKRLRYI